MIEIAAILRADPHDPQGANAMKPPISRYVLFAALAACATRVAAAPTLVSINAAGTGTGNGRTFVPHVAGGGRFAIVESFATDLAPGVTDGNAEIDVFRRDLALGTTALVSRKAASAASGNGGSADAYISADGNIVAFSSTATDLVAGPDTNTRGDVFVRDMTGGATVRASNRVSGGDSANGGSQSLAISADGRVVVFTSNATDLTALADGNAGNDIFAFDRTTGTVSLVSVNRQGNAAGNGSVDDFVCVSPNGRYVAFMSGASDLVAEADTNASIDVFIRDLVAGTTRLVSAAAAGGATANAGSAIQTRCVSDDGRYVAFESSATDLAPNDSDSSTDVFVRDTLLGVTTLVSVNAAATGSGNADAYEARISADGRYVAFQSNATDLVAASSAGAQVFRRDRQSNTTQLVSRTPAGNSGNSNAGSHAMTPSGDAIVFASAATDLAGGADGNGGRDVFLWQPGGSVVRLSTTASGNAGNGGSDDPGISVDGGVVFRSLASDFAGSDTNGDYDVFVMQSRLFANGVE
jgi:Tol biopolymer transport system component